MLLSSLLVLLHGTKGLELHSQNRFSLQKGFDFLNAAAESAGSEVTGQEFGAHIG